MPPAKAPLPRAVCRVTYSKSRKSRKEPSRTHIGVVAMIGAISTTWPMLTAALKRRKPTVSNKLSEKNERSARRSGHTITEITDGIDGGGSEGDELGGAVHGRDAV